MQGKYNLRQDITLESLLVLFIFFNPTDNFDVGVDIWVFTLANFGVALCSLLLTILITYSVLKWKGISEGIQVLNVQKLYSFILPDTSICMQCILLLHWQPGPGELNRGLLRVSVGVVIMDPTGALR